MEILEIIRLRTASLCRDDIAGQIRESIGQTQGPRQVKIEIYHHATVATDLCLMVSIDVDAAEARPSPSDLGCRLASALGEFGLVEHSVWLRKRDRS